jgi:hypothetical protein
MFVLVMDRRTPDWFVTIHATRAEAEQAICDYARTGWIDMYGPGGGWTGDVNGYPRAIPDCIDWLRAGDEYVKLFRADPGAGLGEEIVLAPAAEESAA